MVCEIKENATVVVYITSFLGRLLEYGGGGGRLLETGRLLDTGR